MAYVSQVDRLPHCGCLSHPATKKQRMEKQAEGATCMRLQAQAHSRGKADGCLRCSTVSNDGLKDTASWNSATFMRCMHLCRHQHLGILEQASAANVISEHQCQLITEISLLTSLGASMMHTCDQPPEQASPDAQLGDGAQMISSLKMRYLHVKCEKVYACKSMGLEAPW